MEVDGQYQAERPVAAYWNELALRTWQKPSVKPRKVKPEVIQREIWDKLQEDHFHYQPLLVLESLQLLEKYGAAVDGVYILHCPSQLVLTALADSFNSYLWPGYDDDSTNYHVLLIALLVTVKSREDLPTWDIFMKDPENFSSFFRRVLSLSLDLSLTTPIRTHLLSFLISAFQSLDNGLVRKECAPLVSISIWHNLSEETARDRKFEEHGQLRKAWRASAKRYEAAEEASQTRLRFERSWLFTLVADFIRQLQNSVPDEIVYCERFLEFLTDLESQLPTRRYVNTLLHDLNLLALIRLSPMFNSPENGLLRDLFSLFRHFMYFSIDDNSGVQHSQDQSYSIHCGRLARLQRTALKHFKSKLTILALSNYGAIDQRHDLEGHLAPLTDAELGELCSLLGFRMKYPSATGIQVDRELIMETLILSHERRKTFQDSVNGMSVMPTETALYEESLLRNETYNGSRSLAIPKINLQYLSIGDFLWRSFILYRCEQFFEIKNYLEDTIKRLRPNRGAGDGTVAFEGFSKMALPITRPGILESAPAKVGFDQPAHVRAEITLNVSKLAEHVRREWDTLRPEDTIYLLSVHPQDEPRTLLNGHASASRKFESGISALRIAEVVQLLDENGRPVRDPASHQTNGYSSRPRIRRLIVHLDAAAFKADSESKDKGVRDVYNSINLIVRRNKRENNFKKVLETIKTLVLSDIAIPSWLQEVFLGYGDPTSATFARLANQLKALDLQDTLINWDHLLESFPEKPIETPSDQSAGFGPPYVLENVVDEALPALKPSKKRRRDDDEPEQQLAKIIKVSTYETPSSGPYPSDLPKRNCIRFTPTQVKAIVSGTQPGLTVIVGPPGTGKTDVATQIISNIYHDFPSQRTLLITHSNQALNQLFQKIIKLDIDGRHLLRLGQGEGDLETDESYSKLGRVDSFFENRARYLAEVDRLAANFGAPGAHGNSCETAGYFNSVYVLPAWKKFWILAKEDSSTVSDIISSFPFYDYFKNAPQPLFPSDGSKEIVLKIAEGCERHIEKIFTELEDIRPFEVLRNNKDRSNYLMLKEARIIAMTSTHAAMRRQDIADLGFHYDNVIMEEAAQVTEIETFIPLAMQSPKNGKIPLQRIVLCGDHLQNSPVIQNMAFCQFANLEQSLFLRLVRLNVPTINLDCQGRARPSIAELYKWRYSKLENLPNVLQEREYLQANAGFGCEYQFIDVPDYKGKGESQPSPHFLQNLGEAEYAVAIYQYMRLLGYPASKISILTTYAGQRALIRDVLGHRCAKNRLFGMPRIVTTVDKYQGEQNDYIILSLTRTTRPGYLRDPRRLTVALSRARLGLYILGRRSVFQSSSELTKAFALPLERPASLMLTTGETHPTNRLLGDQIDAVEMTGVEHLGQYVYEMTQAKVQMLKAGNGMVPPQEPEGAVDIDGEDDEEGDEEEEDGVEEEMEEIT